MYRERVVELEEPGVRVPENLDHYRQLHRAGSVQPQVRPNEDGVGTREASVVQADGLGRRPCDPRLEPVAQRARLLTRGRGRGSRQHADQEQPVSEHGPKIRAKLVFVTD